MALWATRRAGALGMIAAAWLGLVGCSGETAKPDAANTAAAQPDASKGDAKTNPQTPATPATAANSGGAPKGKAAPPTDDPLYHPFAEAAWDASAPPLLVNKPADTTLTGKPAFHILDAVQQLWDEIRFTTPDGKRIDYTAVLETDCGEIEIALRPNVAPNHVRSFVALVRAGYYDGLRFDRIRHEVIPEQPGEPYHAIEAGCPLANGAVDDCSIGYWLKPEESPGLTHEVGAVGACHGAERDSAACKFYITLCNAPYLDGNYTIFGKVTRGLDVARTIGLRPVIIDDSDTPGCNRPKDPIVIRKATIHTQVGAAPEGK